MMVLLKIMVLLNHVLSLKQRRIPEGDAAIDAEDEVALQP